MEQRLSTPNTQGSHGLKIKVAGIGGAGINALYKLCLENIPSVEFCAMDCDANILSQCTIDEKILLGRKNTRSMSAGGDSAAGEASAIEDLDAIKNAVASVDLLFIIAGLGGGTGGGAAPIVAHCAAEGGAKVISFCTMPFEVEGAQKKAEAQESLRKLELESDATIPLPNDILLRNASAEAGLLDAFLKADTCMSMAVKSICKMLLCTGLINIDFAVVKSLFAKKSKRTIFGVGCGDGEDCVNAALSDLSKCPLLNLPKAPEKADNVLINVICGADMGMNKLQYILESVSNMFSAKEKVRIGAIVDESYKGRVEICVIGASGISDGTQAAFSGAAPVKNAEHFEEKSKHGERIKAKIKKKIFKPKPETETEQSEFAFMQMSKQRGFFEDTEPNLYRGEDLDVPTFMRKNIKIPL